MRNNIILCLLLFSNSLLGQMQQWTAPSQANTINNPVISSQESIKLSKKLYDQYCGVCHGNRGKGDGVAGVALQPKPANFTKPIFTQQKDGAIFWKITTGKAPMAAYKGIISDDEIWSIINYIRSFSKTLAK